MRLAELRQQALEPPERQIHLARVQGEQALQQGFRGLLHRGRALKIHAGIKMLPADSHSAPRRLRKSGEPCRRGMWPAGAERHPPYSATAASNGSSTSGSTGSTNCGNGGSGGSGGKGGTSTGGKGGSGGKSSSKGGSAKSSKKS